MWSYSMTRLTRLTLVRHWLLSTHLRTTEVEVVSSELLSTIYERMNIFVCRCLYTFLNSLLLNTEFWVHWLVTLTVKWRQNIWLVMCNKTYSDIQRFRQTSKDNSRKIKSPSVFWNDRDYCHQARVYLVAKMVIDCPILYICRITF